MAAAGRRRSRPSALLFLLCLAVGALVYYEVVSDYWSRMPRIAPGPAAASPTLPEPLPEFQLPPLSDFTATVERPLFLPERRPQEPDEDIVAAAPAQTIPLRVVVKGIVLSDAGHFALVHREGSTETLQLAVRDTIDGWSVKEIMADAVIFERDEESLQIELKDLARPSGARTQERDSRRRPRPEGQPSAPARPATGDSGARSGGG